MPTLLRQHLDNRMVTDLPRLAIYSVFPGYPPISSHAADFRVPKRTV